MKCQKTLKSEDPQGALMHFMILCILWWCKVSNSRDNGCGCEE